MGFMSWLTGRDEKESDVYANFEKVEEVVSGIKKISSNEVETAQEAVNNAIKDLNNVNGLAQFVGTVDVNGFNTVFESIATTISQIGEQIQVKADDIKAYEEASFWEKAGSTMSMAFAKTGEGILSVVEDLGDGVVSLVGWVAPKDSGLEKACSSFVEKEWSHDAFNFYYESDFAKKSVFTEDSAAASAFKIAGSVAGTLAISAATAGAFSGAGIAAKGTKAAKAANILIGNTTRANTTMAFLMGMGAGTESGLNQGLSFDDAAWSGAKQGTVQAGIAYGAGKLGEYNAKKNAIKAAQTEVDDAAATVKKANEAFNQADDALGAATERKAQAGRNFDIAGEELNEELTKNGFDVVSELEGPHGIGPNPSSNANIKEKYDAFKAFRKGNEMAEKQLDNALSKAKAMRNSLNNADEVLQSKNAALEQVKNAKLSSYQGYNDAISKKAYSVGEKIGQDGLKTTLKGTATAAGTKIASGTNKVVNAVKDPKKTASNAFKTAKEGVTNTGSTLKTKVTNTGSTLKNKVTTAYDSAKTAVKNTVTGAHPIKDTVKGVTSAAGKVVTAPLKIPGKAVGAVSHGVKAAVASPAIPGVAVATANATGRHLVESYGDAVASTQFKTSEIAKPKTTDTIPTGQGIKYKDPTVTTVEPQPSTTPQNNNGGGSSNKRSSGGGTPRNTSGGGASAAPATGSQPSNNASTEQFKKTEKKNNNSNNNNNNSSSNNNTNTTTTTTTPTNTTPTTTTTTPPSNNTNNTTTTTTTPPTQNTVPQTPQTSTPTSTGGGSQHSGGGYSASSGYTGYTGNNDADISFEDNEGLDSMDDVLSNSTTSIDDVIKGSKYTKIPTSSKPITSSSSGSGGSAVIPAVAGLSAAAAAGIGAKVYMDRKNNNSNGEEDIDTEEWSGEDTINLDYDDSSDTESYLDDDDDYGYQSEEQTERYDARNNEELADLQ